MIIIVTGSFTVPAEALPDLGPHMRLMVTATGAEACCGYFNFVAQADNPNRFHSIGLWDSWASHERHLASAHSARWRAACRSYHIDHTDIAKHALSARMSAVKAVATVEPCGTVTAVLSLRRAGIVTLCLAHRTRRSYDLMSVAKDGALHPAEWCERCRAALEASSPNRAVASAPGAMARWALVLAFFDASGVPDDDDYSEWPPPRRAR